MSASEAGILQTSARNSRAANASLGRTDLALYVGKALTSANQRHKSSMNQPTNELMNLLNLTGSPWRDRISLAILELQEKGVIQMLYDKWWKNTGDVCNRDDKSKESKANALGVENIGKSEITFPRLED
jgi:hypothetical protein